jgi:energy-coupling factor transport system permease protein
MSALYDLYQPGDSWLHRLDPRVKLALVVAAGALLLVFRNVWIMFAASLLLLLSLASARIARGRIISVWRITLPTMLLVAGLWVVFNPAVGAAFLSLWFIRVSAANLAQGVALALRIGALAALIFSWLFTTDQTTLVRSLVALGLPYEWGLTLAMALRYLPTMGAILRMISEAQQARALNLTRGNPLRRARAYTPIVVAMLITALRTAENLSRALESRALGAPRRRTYLRQLHLRRADMLWLVGIVAFTVALLWARFALGFGAAPLALLP